MDLQDRFDRLRADEQHMRPEDYAMHARVQARLFPTIGQRRRTSIPWLAYVSFLAAILLVGAAFGSAAGVLWGVGMHGLAAFTIACAAYCLGNAIRWYMRRSCD